MSLSKVLGLVNLHVNTELGEMTETRPLGVISFLSRYALMDFSLSNLSNSGIDKIGIICPEFPQSVLKHIGNGTSWTANTKTGLLSLMYSERGILNPKTNTDIRIINENDWLIKRVEPEYIIVSPSHVVCNIDFEKVLEKHIEQRADVTIVYVNTDKLDKEYSNSPVLTISDSGLVSKISVNISKKKTGNASLEMYIISRKSFNSIISVEENISPTYGIAEMIANLHENKKLKVFGHLFDGYVRIVNSLSQYHRVSLELLDHYKRDELFRENAPILTTTHNTPPSQYGPSANVKHSFIANGAEINGAVEGSIISRNVTISKGAFIKNCILFNGAYIGPNVILENVIVDKQTTINSKQELRGSSENPIYIKRGVKV